MRLWHIAERSAWRGGTYAPPSLAAEGFVHCSTFDQILRTAHRYYAGRTDLVLLELDAGRLGAAAVRFDPVGGARFPHVYGPIPAEAVVAVHPFGAPFEPPPLTETAEGIREAFALEPLPGEGGYFRETWRTEHSTAIWYLLTPDTCSALHRLDTGEVYHAYAGAPVALLLLHADGHGERVVLGRDLARGELPQVVVPRGTWQGARGMGAWSLVGTTMAPPFRPEGFELGDRTALIEQWPGFAKDVEELTCA